MELIVYPPLMIALYVVIIIFCALAIARAHLFLGMIPLICVFSRIQVGGYDLSPEKTYVLILLPVLFYLAFFKKGPSQSRRAAIPRTITFTFILFWLLLFAMQLLNAGGGPSGPTLIYLAGIMGKGLIVFFVVAFIDTLEKFNLCLKTLILSLLIIVVLGCVELLLFGDLFSFRHESYSTNLAISGFTPIYNPNLLGRNILVLVPFALFGIHYFRRNIFYFHASVFTTAGSALLLLATLSRACMLGFLAGALILMFFYRRKLLASSRFSVPVLIIVCVLVGVLTGGELAERYISVYQEIALPTNATGIFDVGLRTRNWIAVIGIIKDYPLTGIPLGKLVDFLMRYGSIELPGDELFVVAIHGTLLKYAVLGGIQTAAVFVLMEFNYLKYLLSMAKVAKAGTKRFFIRTVFAAAVAVIIASISADPFTLNILWFSIGIVFAGVFVLEDSDGITKIKEQKPHERM